MDCGCYCCRELSGEPCFERHPEKDRVPVKYLPEGKFYWGYYVKEARGRWVKICVDCKRELSCDDDGDGEELEAEFYSE